MSPPGLRRSRRRNSEDDGLDRRHPFENVPRFSSPSRPRRDTGNFEDLRKLGRATAVSCMIQSVLWIGMSAATILVYRDIIPTPKIPPVDYPWDDQNKTHANVDNFHTMLTYLYFKEGAIIPYMPEEGLMTKRTMYCMMSSVFIINVFWFITSSVMFSKLLSGGPRSWVVSVRVWAFSMVVVTIMDVVLGSAMVRDLLVLQEDELPIIDNSTSTTYTVRLLMKYCAGLVLVVSIRLGLLLIANVGLMIALLYLLSNRLNPPKRSAADPSTRESPSATKREGPIDAFLFSNSENHSMGMRNPAFVDDAPVPVNIPPQSNWTSFKPPPEEPRRVQRAPDPVHVPVQVPVASEKRLRRITSEDMAHLSWMEEPERHTDVEFRRPLGWPAPLAPVEHRHAVFEPTSPTQPEQPTLPEGHTGHGPGFGFSYLHGPGHMLPRVRVNPDAPKLPSIPPPDYSPPSRRATVQRGARRGPRPASTALPVPIPSAPAAAAPAAVHAGGGGGAHCADNASVASAESAENTEDEGLQNSDFFPAPPSPVVTHEVGEAAHAVIEFLEDTINEFAVKLEEYSDGEEEA